MPGTMLRDRYQDNRRLYLLSRSLQSGTKEVLFCKYDNRDMHLITNIPYALKN